MKKFKINKIVCLTLCFIVFSSVVVTSASTNKETRSIKTYRALEADPFPHESNPPF